MLAQGQGPNKELFSSLRSAHNAVKIYQDIHNFIPESKILIRMKNTCNRKDWAKKQTIDKAVKETDQMEKTRKAPGTNSLDCYVLLLEAIVTVWESLSCCSSWLFFFS